MSRKIGIMGGTFNPIHNGHVRLALAAYKELNLDKVLFMPSKIPPHKMKDEILKDKLRADMVKLAINEYPFFEYSDFELIRDTTTYTSETLELLKTRTDEEIYFIMGADSFIDIEKWNRPEIVIKLAVIVVAARQNNNIESLAKHKQYLQDKYDAKVHILNMREINISSSDIRKMISCNEDISDYVSDDVLQYILMNKLYVI